MQIVSLLKKYFYVEVFLAVTCVFTCVNNRIGRAFFYSVKAELRRVVMLRLIIGEASGGRREEGGRRR